MLGNYVLVDIEWIEIMPGVCNPTQIAAIKVNENWETLSSINMLIKPRDKVFYQWEHMAYTGYTADDFLNAANVHEALSSFDEWLGEDDVLCWWNRHCGQTYCAFLKKYTDKDDTHKFVVLGEHVRSFLSKLEISERNPYTIAARRKIKVKGAEHCAASDVETIRRVLCSVNFPQSIIDLILLAGSANKMIWEYCIDNSTKLLHRTDSVCMEKIHDYKYVGSLRKCIRKNIKPCPICMKEEYNKARRERCEDIINRAQYKYIYLENSKIFHSCDCRLINRSVNVLGCMSYEAAVNTGRRPCKRCDPKPIDVLTEFENKKIHVRTGSINNKKSKKRKQNLTNEQKALDRHRRSQNEQANNAFIKHYPGMDESDFEILTNPRYAFWAGKGYKNFHLRNCPKMKTLSGLRGFRLYSHAVKAGFTPCKKCNPTAKNDAVVAVAKNSVVRRDENIIDIEHMCDKAGYRWSIEGDFFHIHTPVGKWKINTRAKPILLYHINLSKPWFSKKNYHQQPYVFFSLTDVFNYVDKHDKDIIKHGWNVNP